AEFWWRPLSVRRKAGARSGTGHGRAEAHSSLQRFQKNKASALEQRLLISWKPCLLHLGKDDHQRVEGKGLDQGETKNQRQLNSGTSCRIAGQSFGGCGSGLGLC